MNTSNGIGNLKSKKIGKNKIIPAPNMLSSSSSSFFLMKQNINNNKNNNENNDKKKNKTIN